MKLNEYYIPANHETYEIGTNGGNVFKNREIPDFLILLQADFFLQKKRLT